MKILTGKQARPRRVILYGVEGVGKSTWAAGAPSPIFVDIEGGIADIDVAKTHVLKSWGEVVAAVNYLATEQHEFRTVVIDSVDWLEKLIWQQVCANHNTTSVEKVGGGFGKGHKFAAELVIELTNLLDGLRRKGLSVVLIGHCKTERVENPELPTYTQYTPDLHKDAASHLREWADEVLFATTRIFTRQEDLGFSKSRQVALGGNERYIQTSHSAGVCAKNRLGLPSELPLDWAAYQQYWPASEPVGNISGVVVDGSSKLKTESLS
jgi:hypothetical protein